MQNIGSPDFGGPLSHADAITADGRTIVGTDSAVGVGTRAWLATLPCSATLPEVEGSLVVTGAPTSTISWSDPHGPFNVYRGSVSGAWSYNQTCFDPNTAGPSTDPTVPAADSFYFYLVSRRDTCGHESIVGLDSAGLPIPNTASCP